MVESIERDIGFVVSVSDAWLFVEVVEVLVPVVVLLQETADVEVIVGDVEIIDEVKVVVEVVELVGVVVVAVVVRLVVLVVTVSLYIVIPISSAERPVLNMDKSSM